LGGREVIFEGQPDMPVAGRQRYLSPPPRDDELAPVRRHETSDREARTVGPSEGMESPEEQLRASTFPAPPADSGATPRTETAGTSDAGSPGRPWGPLLMTVLGLFGSLGFNFYLGWIAWDLYARYQDAVDDIQELEAKLEAKQHELAVSAVPRSVARRTHVAAG
jgi:hypothetical protein